MDLEALLLPHWAVLKRQTFFDRLAPELQVKALAEALEPLHPREAHEVREWTPPTTRTMLARLDGSLRRGQARPQQVGRPSRMPGTRRADDASGPPAGGAVALCWIPSAFQRPVAI